MLSVKVLRIPTNGPRFLRVKPLSSKLPFPFWLSLWIGFFVGHVASCLHLQHKSVSGTGSTSWFFNINKLNDQCVSDLLRIIGEELSMPMPYDDAQVVRRICDAFNNRLIFAPDLESKSLE